MEDSDLKCAKLENENLFLAIFSHKNSPESFEPYFLNIESKHLIIDGFIKNREEIISNNIISKINVPSFYCQCSGIYNIVYYDESINELIIANDRHGARYLYYYEDENYFIFAPNPKIIMMSELVINRQLDYEAIISILSHEYIMGDRSIEASIKLLSYASFVRLRNNKKQVIKYWNFDALSTIKHTDKYETIIDNGITLLEDSICSYAHDDSKIIVPLSGGLDSRTISCFISKKKKVEALHVDYGYEKKLAARIANELDINLKTYPLTSFDVNSIEPFILCASHSIHQFWIYSFLKKHLESTNGTLVLDGYLMNEVIGGLSTIKQTDYSNINKIYPPLGKAFDFILGDKIKDEYYERHDLQVKESLTNCPSHNDYDKYLYFTTLNYGRRYTLLFSIVHQYLCSVGLPILDYDFMDFCHKIPFELKINSKLYRDMVSKSFPEIAKIPWSRNRLPLNSNKKQSAICDYIKKINKIKYYISRITNSKIETLPKHNKNVRFRKDRSYREYFINFIHNEQTFDKGYVSRSGINKIIELIDSGRNYFDLLEKVVLIEILCRELDI